MVGPPTLASFAFDGRAALELVLTSSSYGTIAQAVASLTAFTHPDTVAQIPGSALFPCIRSVGRHDRYTIDVREGRRLGFDDNVVARDTFGWCNGRTRRGRDVHLNHIYQRRHDPGAFSAPANMCASPAFLAKLTDDDQDIKALLRRRAYHLYGWMPESNVPPKPVSYDNLLWADPLPAVLNLEGVLRSHMKRRPKHFAVQIAREIGWAFSGGEPDSAFANTF